MWVAIFDPIAPFFGYIEPTRPYSLAILKKNRILLSYLYIFSVQLYLPTTVRFADANEVWNVGASLMTSHR